MDKGTTGRDKSWKSHKNEPATSQPSSNLVSHCMGSSIIAVCLGFVCEDMKGETYQALKQLILYSLLSLAVPACFIVFAMAGIE